MESEPWNLSRAVGLGRAVGRRGAASLRPQDARADRLSERLDDGHALLGGEDVDVDHHVAHRLGGRQLLRKDVAARLRGMFLDGS